MNWLDFVLISVLLMFLILGTKIGLVRSLMRFVALGAGIIITTHNSDIIAVEIARYIDASPMVVAVVSFIVLLAILYGLFRIVVFLFYKVSNLQDLGKTDKIGGAVMGTIWGWLLMGLLLFLMVLMPMPAGFYRMVDGSTLTQPMMRTLPILYEGTGVLHPSNRSFSNKVKVSLTETNKIRFDTVGEPENSEARLRANESINNTMFYVDKYFGQLKTLKSAEKPPVVQN